MGVGCVGIIILSFRISFHLICLHGLYIYVLSWLPNNSELHLFFFFGLEDKTAELYNKKFIVSTVLVCHIPLIRLHGFEKDLT